MKPEGLGDMTTATQKDGFLDDATCRRLHAREPAAIDAWFTQYSDALYNFAYYRVGQNREAAADVVQDTFVEAIHKIEQYDRERGTMFTWLTYLSRNHIKRARRYAERLTPISQDWEQLDATLARAYKNLATEPLPDEVLERSELTTIVQMTMSSIPTNYRQALDEYYYRKKSTRDVGISFGISEGAAKSLLHRARLAFKTAFETFVESLEYPKADART